MRGFRARALATMLCVASGACDASVGEPTTPSAAATSYAAPTTAPPSAAPTSVPDNVVKTPAATPFGWWRSDALCLELFANGDFELAVMGSGPKTLIMGTASLSATTQDAFTATLAVQRIWRARFTGPCRRVHELGDWTATQDALGSTFTANATGSLVLKRLADDRIELCGSSCVTLTRDVPTFGGKWRRAGLENPSQPEMPYAAGDLLEIAISDVISHVWIAKDATSWAEQTGTFAIASRGDDRFTVTFTPVEGEPMKLAAHRLPSERIEVCATPAKPERCTILERSFDAYDHDIR